jgi:hypothetical protein
MMQVVRPVGVEFSLGGASLRLAVFDQGSHVEDLVGTLRRNGATPIVIVGEHDPSVPDGIDDWVRRRPVPSKYTRIRGVDQGDSEGCAILGHGGAANTSLRA